MAAEIWFIAGASRGLGRVWAQAALERGDKVAATVRDPASIADLVRDHGDAVLPLMLDVTDRAAVFAAFDAAQRQFGRIDVVVANAGYGLFGTIEESSEDQSRAQMDANFFGVLWVVQAALPQLRAQGGGHVLITSSMAGVITFPTAGVYNASKWALEGLGETLAQEVAAFNIKVTLIEPAGYATDWRGASATRAAPMPAYDGLRERLRAAAGGRPIGDPAATAGAILAAVDAEQPPLRLFLGTAGLPAARRAYADRLAVWEAWAPVSEAAQGG
jgi:NAD(P)-dependent dehydrogenase (short-subunit alcohol dehydrogenase family)